jgi:AsmA-like C-terminal region
MDLSAIYSKTPKGLRARASLIGGLSSHLMKVLTHVDGSAKAENILLKFDNLTPQQLSADLTKLEHEGYIRLATVTANSDDGWALTANFTPMVVEEYQSEEELDATAKAQNEAQARIDAENKVKAQEARQLATEQKAKQEEDRQLAATLKAEKKAQKLRDKEKTKAEVKVKAQLELERKDEENRQKKRIAEEAAKAAEAARIIAEAEAKLKAQQEAARIAEQQAAERAAKLEEETRQKAEMKAREAAEQAEADAEAAAKEQARSEIERISREAEEAQRKADAETKAKLEAARTEALNLAQAEAEQIKLKAKAEAQALQAKIKATEAAEMQAIQAREQALAEAKAVEKALQEQNAEQAEKEKVHADIASVLRKAEEDRKNAAALAKAEKLEAKRKAKAEQDARVQAERKAKDEAKELIKEQAKQIKLAAQAEEKAKLEAAENSKREMARIAKEAELVREHAEQQLKQQSKHQSKQQSKNQAKQEIDALANNAEVAKTELKNNTENIGLKHSQTVQVAHAKLESEEQVNIGAKENARLEMERIGREADLARKKFTAEQHLEETNKSLPNKDLPILDDFDAAEAAEEAAFEAEERAEETKAKTHKVADSSTDKATQRAAEDAGRASIKDAARAEAEANASIQPKTKSLIPIRKVKQWLSAISKLMFIYVPALLLVLLVLAHFINLSTLIKPIEQLATDSLGEPVAIKKVHASLWPQPHLVLEDVAIGAVDNIKAIHVLPEVYSLFEDVKVAKSIVIDGLNIEEANFGKPLNWSNNLSTAKNLKVEQINLKNLTLAVRDLTLEPFDGKVTLTEIGALGAIELVSSNNALSVVITPLGGEYEIALKAANWALPFNQKIVFGTLNAKGLASANQINFSQIQAEMYGGNLSATASINWPNGTNQWVGAGDFRLENAFSEQLLNNFGSAVVIDGKLALNGSFSSKASNANQLAAASALSANFDVRQGGIEEIELARAVLTRGGQSLAGDTTNFDKLTGNIKINKGQYQFGKLVLSSPQLIASGYLNIAANQDVSGRLNADLAAQSRRLQANFGVSGRGKALKSN